MCVENIVSTLNVSREKGRECSAISSTGEETNFLRLMLGAWGWSSLPAICATSKQVVRSRCPLFRSVQRVFLESVGCTAKFMLVRKIHFVPTQQIPRSSRPFVRRLIYFLHNFPVTERYTRKTLPTRLFNNFNTFVRIDAYVSSFELFNLFRICRPVRWRNHLAFLSFFFFLFSRRIERAASCAWE